VEAARRQESQQDELKRAQLAKSQWIFRKKPEGHTEKEAAKLEGMDWKHLLTVLAYQMRLILQDIYKLRSAKQAREQLEQWCQCY